MTALVLLASLVLQEAETPVIIKASWDRSDLAAEISCEITWRDGVGAVTRRVETEDGKIRKWKGSLEKVDLQTLLETLKKHKLSEQKTDICHGDHTDVFFSISATVDGRKSGFSHCFCRGRHAETKVLLEALRDFIEAYAREEVKG